MKRNKTGMLKKKRKDKIFYTLFATPAILAFLIVIAVPFCLGVYYSFTNWTGITQSTLDFVGFKNYIDSVTNTRFQYSIMITIVFGLLNFVVVNVISFSLALLVSSKVKGRNLYRTGFFVPNLIGGIVLGYIWQFIFNNVFISFGEMANISFLANKFFLSDPKLAIIALVMTSSWQYAGYIMMIYYTALQNVPTELIEASKLDGATAWQRLKKITIPMIMPAFTITLFLTLTNSFKQYDVILSLTGGGPSTMFMGQAIKATEVISMNIFNTASVENMMAQGQAKAVLFFIALVVISLIQTSITRKKEVES
ncbi:carbohydrate ABC transporter permease [Anaerorhabdus sp.]|uniref:carbohydrate ABC transporter permease n=1 Tax=Anaerorhabdus sp. TaxID=1872524 RepID=UPI002FC75799